MLAQIHKLETRGKGLTGFLASLAVRVFLAACDDSVDADENSQNSSKGRLDCDQDDAGDGLCGLGDAKLFNEDENADDGEDTDDLDEDVDDVAGSSLIGAAPEEEAEH